MITTPNYLKELLTVMDNDKTIGIAGSKLINVKDQIYECGLNINKKLDVKFIGQNEQIDFLDDKEYIDCDYCSSCSILFRRDVFEKAGKFDPYFSPEYLEDADLAFKLKYNLNLKTVCVPKSKVYSLRNFLDLCTDEFIKNNNSLYFLDKWQKYLKN